MRILLIPGLWLDASSWNSILPALQEAGHDAIPLTMPGVGAPASESADIGIRDWIDAVVAEVDASLEPVALVGHSGGGNVAWAAASARPDRVAHVVFVDTIPVPPGSGISEFPVVDGVVPFPGWDFFEDEDTWDLDAGTRAATAPRTRSVPARVPTDPLPLEGDGRFDVPVTLLMGGMDEAEFRAAVATWGGYGDEFARIRSARVVTLGTAHWPQFTQPERLAREILAALA